MVPKGKPRHQKWCLFCFYMPKVFTTNPFDYNYHTILKARQDKSVELTPSAAKMQMIPEYSLIAKMLGIQDKGDWNQYSEKLAYIVNWAIDRAQSSDIGLITDAIKEKLNVAPQVNEKRINDLWVACKLDDLKKKEKAKDFNGNENRY